MRGRGRLLILLGLVILLAVVAVIVVLQGNILTSSTGGEGGGGTSPQVQAVPTNTPIPFIEVVVAIQELPRGLRIPEEGAVETRLFPVTDEAPVPFNALQDLDDVIGMIARTDIPRESLVLSTMLVPSLQDIADVGSDAAAVMPPTTVAVSIPMDRFTGVAYAIREGDYVDVVLSMLFVDIDEEFQTRLPNQITLVSIDEAGNVVPQQGIEGRLDVGLGGSPVIVGPSEGEQRPRLLTQRTVQNAWVLRTGDFPIEGNYIGVLPSPTPRPTVSQSDTGGDTAERPPAQPTPKPPPDIITLAVSPQDAVVLVWAVESRIPITLLLRAATSISQTPTQAVTLEYIMSNFNISAPNRLPYSLEPALRSVRQLVFFETVSTVSSPAN